MDFKNQLSLKKESETVFKIHHPITGHEFFEYKYYPENGISVQKWSGSLDDDEIIGIYRQMALFTKEYKQPIRASISDLTKTESSFHRTNQWVAKELIPESIKWGYRYAFFVQPEEYFAQLALEDAVDELTDIKGLKEVRIFECLEEASDYARTLLKAS